MCIRDRPVGKQVRVRIIAKDVLHNFDLPHFRVKMDAVPGLPTYFKFTPTVTTEEYRQNLGELDNQGNPLYPEWHEPYDPEDPESKKRYEEFNYELACAELCGKGHYSMKRIVEVVSYEEWEEWMKNQNSYYMTTIRNTDEDPRKGKLLDIEIMNRARDFGSAVKTALAATDEAGKILRLEHVTFKTGSAELTEDSRYELTNLKNALKDYPNMKIELAGHTDNVGNPDANVALSNSRAMSVYNYLISKGISGDRLTAVGYGAAVPLVDNDTPENRAKNRRTEFKIIAQ